MSSAGLENALFNLKFTAKSLNRQAMKAGKEELAEKAKVEKAIKQGNTDIARICAQNAVRKQNEKLNLLQLASRIDAVAGRVQTAVTMRSVTANMQKVVKSMNVAMKSMNLDTISAIMDGFDKNSEELDVADVFMRDATSSTTAVGTPQGDVDLLMSQAADKVGVELHQDLEAVTPANTKIAAPAQDVTAFEERLAALRN